MSKFLVAKINPPPEKPNFFGGKQRKKRKKVAGGYPVPISAHVHPTHAAVERVRTGAGAGAYGRETACRSASRNSAAPDRAAEAAAFLAECRQSTALISMFSTERWSVFAREAAPRLLLHRTIDRKKMACPDVQDACWGMPSVHALLLLTVVRVVGFGLSRYRMKKNGTTRRL